MTHTMQTTIDTYREKEGEDYVSLSVDEAGEAIMADECLSKMEKSGIIRNMRSQAHRKGYPPFIFVSPLAFRRYKLLQTKLAKTCQPKEPN